MTQIILWYVAISLIGLLAFPLSFRLLPALADRGYAVSRIIGLLLWGYLYWVLGSLGVLKNDNGGAIFALCLLLIMSGLALRGSGWKDLQRWVRDQRRLIVIVEVLFLLAFVVFAFIRSANPDLIGTEKPMELAFINAILRSPTLPPNDPWLSGYTISYYYFGYVLVAMLARICGTPAAVSFNLGISLIFSLSALGSFSVLFNLLSQESNARLDAQTLSSGCKNIKSAFLGPFFVFIVSNMGGVLHVLRLLGVFWGEDETGQLVSKIWAWLDMGRYAQPPPAETFPHWWWWQASRIVQDFDFNWVNKGDIIDEFPFFSYLLADLHPHVLAMPFAFLAITLAFNLFTGGGKGVTRWFGLEFQIAPVYFLFSSVVLGSLGFFNTWDFPFYVALYAGAYVLHFVFFNRETLDDRVSGWQVFWDWIKLGFALGVSGGLFYLPFYLGFQSQAGGPLPNLIYITRGIYFWIHFMPLLVPILLFLLNIWFSKRRHRDGLKWGFILTSGLLGVLLTLSLVLTVLIANIHLFEGFNPEASTVANTFLGSMAAPGWWPVIREGFVRRLSAPGTWISLSIMLILSIALLWPRQVSGKDEKSSDGPMTFRPSDLFTLLLILLGALLVVAPEFVFLRDLFGYRINTIFKFYFQVWLMWSMAAAYGVVYLWRNLSGSWMYVVRGSIVLVIILSLTYPIMALWSKTNGFKPVEGYSLDGTAYIHRVSPDAAAAMDFLKHAPSGVIAEAIGGSYTQYARMSANSGLPTVLGWEFHEMQWRGGTDEMGSRKVDIERLYCTNNWKEAQEILNRYNIRYVVVGDLEYGSYGSGSEHCPGGMNQVKFNLRLTEVFHQGNTVIYQVPGSVDDNLD